MSAPYYEDDLVTLYHGDCREVTEWLSADVLVTDPPYGIGWRVHSAWTERWSKAHDTVGIANDECVSVRDEAVSAWGGRPALVFGSLDAEPPPDWRRMLVFGKPSHAGLIGSRLPWFRNWEPVFVLGEWPDQTPTRSAVVQTRYLAAAGYSGYATKAGHPHAKPLDVLEELIDACPPGAVADPFAGSGTTVEACILEGFRCIAIERETDYLPLITQRIHRRRDPIAAVRGSGEDGGLFDLLAEDGGAA